MLGKFIRKRMENVKVEPSYNDFKDYSHFLIIHSPQDIVDYIIGNGVVKLSDNSILSKNRLLDIIDFFLNNTKKEASGKLFAIFKLSFWFFLITLSILNYLFQNGFYANIFVKPSLTKILFLIVIPIIILLFTLLFISISLFVYRQAYKISDITFKKKYSFIGLLWDILFKKNNPIINEIYNLLKEKIPEVIRKFKEKYKNELYELKLDIPENIVFFRLVKAINDIDPNSMQSIIFTGPTGTGKTQFARLIHRISARKEKKFVEVSNLELQGDDGLSRWTGWKKNAFTGATFDHEGFAEKANNGTLFIDEIGELENRMKSSLLTTLSKKEILPRGAEAGKEEVITNFRLISATTKDLNDTKYFQMDFVSRIADVEIKMPALIEYIDEVDNLFFNRMILSAMEKINSNIKLKKDKDIIFPDEIISFIKNSNEYIKFLNVDKCNKNIRGLISVCEKILCINNFSLLNIIEEFLVKNELVKSSPKKEEIELENKDKTAFLHKKYDSLTDIENDEEFFEICIHLFEKYHDLSANIIMDNYLNESKDKSAVSNRFKSIELSEYKFFKLTDEDVNKKVGDKWSIKDVEKLLIKEYTKLGKITPKEKNLP